MSRKELLAPPAGSGAASSASPCTTGRQAPDVDELRAAYDLVVAADGAQLRRSAAAVRRRVRALAWTGGTTSTCGSAPTWSSRRSSSSSSRREWGTMQIHGYPYSDAGLDLHRRDARGRVATRPASTPPRTPSSRPGASDEQRRRADRARSSPTSSAATSCSPTTPSGSTSPPSATSAGTTATWCCSATPRTPRTSRSARAPSWRWRTRSRSPPACTSTRTSRPALAAYEAERKPGRRVDPARGAGLARVVREHRHVRRPGAGPVLLQPADPLPPDHLREPAGPRRRRSPPGWRPRSPAARGLTTVGAGDVPAVPDRRAGAEEPGHRLADGHVLRRRRRARRLPPRPPRLEGARRRRPGHDRDGLRLAGGADHARLHRACGTTSSATPGADHRRSCTRASTAQDRPAARPLRPQGLDPADVGRHGRAARRTATGR